MEKAFLTSSHKENSTFQPHFTHDFIYKLKKFKIDPFLVSRNSDYFDKNIEKFKLCNTIYFEGSENDPDVSDYIQTFLDICHYNNEIKITKENAIPLFYLSYIYEVNLIRSEAERYINDNYEYFASKILEFEINNEKLLFKGSIISKNLVYHIKHDLKDFLSDFPIKFVYEIIRLYFHLYYRKEEEEEIINFLFDCLNHYGREASVLFTFVDFRNENMNVIQKLLNEFNSNFDFSYINESICKLVIEQNKELNQIKSITNTPHIYNNNEFDEKTVIYQDENSVFYKLFEKQKISEVIWSPNVESEVVIPSSIVFGADEYKVTRIGAKAFRQSNILSLSFEEKSNLELIERCAFIETQIQRISLPSSLRKLDTGWCYGTFSLNEVEIDSKNPYFYVNDGVLMYRDEAKQEICFVPRNFKGEFVISEEITRVGDYSFANLYDLQSVKLLSKNILIDEGAFLMCNNLKKFDFNRKKESGSESRITIGNNCFKDCTSIVSFSIPSIAFIELGDSAFVGCEKIKNISFEDFTKLTISDSCFSGDEKLKSIKVKGEEIVFGKQSFSNCISITSVSLINSRKIKLCENAFEDCKYLKKVELDSRSSNIMDKRIIIGSQCFMNCSSLNEIKIEQAFDLTLMNHVFENCDKLKNININSKIMNIGDACFLGTKLCTVKFEGEIIAVGNMCFKDCKSITMFSIPSAIDVEIGCSCFEECKNLKQVSIEAVSSLKLRDKCFYNAKSLSMLGILGNKLIIGKQSFYSCLSLTNLTLLNSNMIFFDDNAFEKCKKLEIVSISARSDFRLGSNYFYRGNKIKPSDLSDKIILIGNNCFMDCCSLSDFKIENISDIKLMKCVFLNCGQLEIINLNSRNMNVGDECFVGSKIKSVIFEGEKIKIGKNCFRDCQSISSLAIQSSNIVELGNSSFEECRNIEEVLIQSFSKLELHDRCFYNNNKLSEIQLLSNEIIIGENSFYNCKSIETLNFQEIERLSMKTRSFENCTLLSTVTISAKSETENKSCLEMSNKLDKKISIEENCFMNCISLSEFIMENISDLILMKTIFSKCNKLEIIYINSRNMIIGDECFVGSKIKSVTFEGEKIKIGKNCFKDCQSITSLIISSSNIVELGNSSFEDCRNIEEVMIQSFSKLELQDRCFYNNINLKSIELNSSKLIVCKHCFYNCYSITSLVFPITNQIILGDNAFEKCKCIKNIFIESSSEESQTNNLFDANAIIGANCFIDCVSLDEFNIGYISNLTLMKNVFVNCKNLESISLSSKNMNIGDECFAGSKVKNVTFEGEKIKIGNKCFKDCQSITSFIIPSSINVEINNSSFEECRNIEEVRIEASAKIELQNRCYYNNYKLKNIQLSSNEINIGQYTFFNCQSITALHLQEMDRLIIKEKAFENCISLSTLTISAKLEIQAGSNCFFNATKLKSVYLNSKKVIIDSSCFADCSSMLSFTISSAEKAILRQQTFENCKNLESVDVTARSKFKMFGLCFNQAYKIKRITINSKKIMIGCRCFDNCYSLSCVNCPIAVDINFFENSFNGIHYNNCLKHPPETKLHSFKSSSSCNDNECIIV